MGKRICLFCGDDGAMTRSHVIAQQFIDALPGTKEGSRFLEERHSESGNGSETSIRESAQNPRVNKPKVLCAKCNNSWMKDHEEAVKELVVDLALGNQVVLTKENQQDLAIWAAIAGAVRGALSFDNPLPEAEARFIRENNKLPDGYQVWLAQGEDRLDWPTRFLPATDYEGNRFGWIAWLWVGKSIFAVASTNVAMDFFLKLAQVYPVVKQIHPANIKVNWPYFEESPLTWQRFHQVTDM